jgi:predicted N-acyltransferase
MKECLLKKDSKTDLEIFVFQSINDINKNHWEKVVEGKNIYLSLGYLEAIEKSLSKEITFRYLIFYNEQSLPVAIAVVQFLPFVDKDFKDEEQLCRVRNKIKSSILASSGIQVMSCGSPFACGENGFMFTKAISEKEAFKNLARGLIRVQKQEKETIKAPVLLLKEFWPESINNADALKSVGFKEFMIDVNMVMKIHSDWKIFEDYLFSMVTKFRTKAKAAFKKSANLRVADFQVQDILENKKSIEKLYNSVVEKSAFTFGALNGDAFVFLKENLKDNFIIQGYFLKDELVGFSSAFIFNDIVDANYVGINYNLNQEHAIYQRMLYDYLELAINTKCKELRFGRTAEEIKSTVGAEPVNMKLYIRHQSNIKNSLLKPVFGSITPSTFELRNPFKAEYQKVK